MPQFSGKSFNINEIPAEADIISVNQERVVKIIVPQGTKLETGQKAAEFGIRKWLDRLAEEGYKCVSDIDIEGPFFCPFEETFGEDMWLGRARFDSLRPRHVPAEMVQASRRMAEDAGYDYETWRSADVRAVPKDALSQLQFVRDNPERVLADMKHKREIEREQGK